VTNWLARVVTWSAAPLGPASSPPLVVQLAGREARWMALGAQLAEAAGADIIDINMEARRSR